MRKITGAVALFFITIGFASGAEILVKFEKIEDQKKLYFSKGSAEARSLPLSEKVKVVKAKVDPATKKVVAGEVIENGLKNEIFTKPQKYVGVILVTEGEGEKEMIVEVRLYSLQK